MTITWKTTVYKTWQSKYWHNESNTSPEEKKKKKKRKGKGRKKRKEKEEITAHSSGGGESSL